MFSTLLTESHAHDAAHDRMMGHRPKDTKTLNYSAKLLPFLATEIERIPFDLVEGAASSGAMSPKAPSTPVGTEGGAMHRPPDRTRPLSARGTVACASTGAFLVTSLVTEPDREDAKSLKT
jgi:hypothetical protein